MPELRRLENSAQPRPATAPGNLDSLRLVSADLRTATLEDLERVAFSREQAALLCGRLAERDVEAAVLSTCNRTEIYWVSRCPSDDTTVQTALHALLPGRAGLRTGSFRELRGEAVAAHVFRVASGLESELIGEPEILGQVREALEIAEASGRPGALLAGVLHAALRTGRYARAQTEIGTGALSVTTAGVLSLIRRYPERVRGTVLVIGTGRVGRGAVRKLTTHGVGRLLIMNRTPAHARAIAAETVAEVVRIEDLARWLREADVVFVATQTSAPLVTAAQVRAALGARPDRPLILLDLSLPRGVDPAVAELEGAVLHNLSSLHEVITANHARRVQEIPRVEAVIARELRMLRVWARRQAFRPLMAELRLHAEAICRAELDGVLPDGGGGRTLVDRLARRMVDRLFHGPRLALERGDVPLEAEHARYLRRLFGLEEGPDGRA